MLEVMLSQKAQLSQDTFLHTHEEEGLHRQQMLQIWVQIA